MRKILSGELRVCCGKTSDGMTVRVVSRSDSTRETGCTALPGRWALQPVILPRRRKERERAETPEGGSENAKKGAVMTEAEGGAAGASECDEKNKRRQKKGEQDR